MTVRELMAKLQKYDPDAEVAYADQYGELDITPILSVRTLLDCKFDNSSISDYYYENQRSLVKEELDYPESLIKEIATLWTDLD